MLLSDVTLEVRLRSFGPVGQVDLGLVRDAQFVKRFNQVGAWKMTLPNDYFMCSHLRSPGSEVVLYVHDEPFMSGPMVEWEVTETTEDPEGVTTFTGADDLVRLADRVCFPTPSTSDVTAQASAYDTQSGVGETVMKHYVDLNIGPAAAGSRAHDAFVSGPDLGRGAQVAYSARFQVLGEVEAVLATAAGLGFDVVRDGDQIVFDVYAPRDLSLLVRMDIYNDLLAKNQSSLSSPKLTVALVGGAGELDARAFTEVTDSQSVEAEGSWGRRIESFVDDGSAQDVAEMVQAGQNELESGGRTVLSLRVVPGDLSTMEFPQDWSVGDIVGVVVDDQLLSGAVSEAILSFGDDESVQVAATVGDPVGYDWESQVISRVQEHERRLSRLEKG